MVQIAALQLALVLIALALLVVVLSVRQRLGKLLVRHTKILTAAKSAETASKAALKSSQESLRSSLATQRLTLSKQKPEKSADAEGMPYGAPVQKVLAREIPNPRWKTHYINKQITIPVKPLVSANDTVFAMGSCFAERIRIALTEQGVHVGPHLGDIPIDEAAYSIDELPKREHMNFFNTFTIRQEFERHLGLWRQADDDYWTIHKPHPVWGGDAYYQDPYRRKIFGRTPEALMQAIRHVDAAMDASIRSATSFFFTLGLSEVFRNKETGKIACQIPGHGGGAGSEETEWHQSTFAENLDNLERLVDMIGQINPNARIVVTVSPVAMSRTFGTHDIVVANTESKSILRVVLGELERKHANVTYFPAYEIVMRNSPYSFREDDGLHVANWVVSKIVAAFKAAHYQETHESLAAE